MKLKVYEEKPKNEEKEIYLRLIECAGEIVLCACDSQGIILKDGDLIHFMDNEFYLKKGIDDSLGFKLDKDKRLVVHHY
jgi:hypothetical protein